MQAWPVGSRSRATGVARVTVHARLKAGRAGARPYRSQPSRRSGLANTRAAVRNVRPTRTPTVLPIIE